MRLLQRWEECHKPKNGQNRGSSGHKVSTKVSYNTKENPLKQGKDTY